MNSGERAGARMIVSLGEVSPNDLVRVGAKAANLAGLLRAGFPVPDGMVVTTEAFQLFLRENSAAEDLTAVRLPGQVREQLTEISATFGDTPLAVRSSAVSEDLPTASFAGQYETVLQVQGPDELAAAVRRCWSSTRSSHLASYRNHHCLSEAGMAVLIQPVIEADAGGVAFTANPVTGSRDEVFIEAVRGLGERQVSGRASPDEWVVSGADARCDASHEAAIDAEQALAVAQLARRVEAHLGRPQDIEWALAAGALHVLQSRPITSLPDPPATPIPLELTIPDGFWMYDASHSPRPGHHVDLLMFPMIRRASQRWATEFGYLFDGVEWTEVGMWPYQRIVPLGGREGPMPPRWLMRLLVRVVPSLRRRVRRAVEVIRSDTPSRYIDRWYEQWQPELDTAVRDHLRVDLTALTDTELVDHVGSAQELLERGIHTHMVLHGALSILLSELASTCEELLGWGLAEAIKLVSGTSHKSTEPARRLHRLTELAADRPAIAGLLEHPELATAKALESADGDFARAFDDYLDRYCHRALGYTLAEPTLAEIPGTVLSLIRNQLHRGYDPDGEAQTRAGVRAVAVAAARARLAGEDQHLRFERALARAERAYPVREDNEFFTMSAPLAVLRYAVLEVGRRLSGRGVIARTPDVMHLELGVALSALLDGRDHHELIERRKGQRAWTELNPGPPFYGEPPPGPPSFDFLAPEARLPMEAIMWSNEAIMAAGPSSDRDGEERPSLVGVPASPGRYSGPVRVVMDESEFDKLQPGDVLVCPISSPVWSVLFPVVGGLVTDTGGVLSHSAIIAREYGIPAVVATGEATARFRDGDLVTVDGTTGTVEPETRATATRNGPLPTEDKDQSSLSENNGRSGGTRTRGQQAQRQRSMDRGGRHG